MAARKPLVQVAGLISRLPAADGLELGTTVVEATGTITTTSTADVLATSMTVTPASGSYLVWFSGSMDNDSNNQTTFASIYAGGTQASSSQRRAVRGNSVVGAGFVAAARVTVNGSQAVEGRWRVSGGTGSMFNRNLLLLRIG